MRLEILDKFGGVYLDMDFKFIKPLDPLNHKFEFFCAHEEEMSPDIANGIIGSTPHHPIIKMAIDKIGKTRIKRTDDNITILTQTGPWFFGEVLFDYWSRHYDRRKPIAVLPYDAFFPFLMQDRVKFIRKELSVQDIVNCATDQTYGIHLWASIWRNDIEN